MRRLKHHLRRHSSRESLGPAWGAQTPVIAGLQSVESDFRTRGGQVIANRGGELQELRGQHDAHRVDAVVTGVGIAAAVAKPAGKRVVGAGLKLAPEHIFSHSTSIAHVDRPRY